MRALSGVLLVAMVFLSSGCAAFRFRVRDRDPASSDALTARYDQRDLIQWAELISNDLLETFPPESVEHPILVVMGIENRTRRHIDTRALADSITTHMMDSEKVSFINADRRDELLSEQGYQMQHATPETRVAIGRQLGARYMLTGSLIEIQTESGRQVRVSKQEDVYYQLTVEVTDLETSLIVARKQRDRLRRARRPLIGW